MRATAFLIAVFVALVTAAPPMDAEKIAERELCVSATMSHARSIQVSCLSSHTLRICVLHESSRRFAPKTVAKALIAVLMALADWQPRSSARLGVGVRGKRSPRSAEQHFQCKGGRGLSGVYMHLGLIFSLKGGCGFS